MKSKITNSGNPCKRNLENTQHIFTLPTDKKVAYVVELSYTGSTAYSLNLNSVNQLICVMVKCGVLFEVRTEFLYNI
jgi:hypothetical protein